MMRRALPGATTVLALVAAATLVPSPAHAVLLQAEAEADVSIYGFGGPATCTVTGPEGAEERKAFTDDGGWTTVTASATRTVADTAAPTDRTVIEARSTAEVRATNAEGAFRSLEVRGSARVVTTADLGAEAGCGLRGSAEPRVRAGIVLTQPGWLTIDLDSRGADSYGASLRIATERLGEYRELELRTSDGLVSTRVHRPAGAYEVDTTLDGGSFGDPGTEETSFSATLTFVPDVTTPAPVVQAGVATAAAQGKGRTYVSLPARVSCSDGTARLRLAGKATALKKVRKATFAATGAKAVKLTKVKPGKTVRLRGITTTGPVTIRATFQLTNGKKATVKRSYAACR